MSGPLPFFTLGPWQIGPLTIHAFGVMVAIGVLLAHEIALRRARLIGLAEARMRSALGHMLLVGFVGAHVFALLLYEPARLVEEPLALLKINGALSSYGGLLGALIGLAIFRKRAPDVALRKVVDAAAFALPFGWLFGRIGCALAHDHPGALTSFFLAVDFGNHAPGGVRHDLGLYEALWWVVIVGLFVLLDRARPALRQRPWFYPGLLAVLYGPARFMLDFLRAGPTEGGDVRFLGLTPAQYLSAVILVVGILLLTRGRTEQHVREPVDRPSAGDVAEELSAAARPHLDQA